MPQGVEEAMLTSNLHFPGAHRSQVKFHRSNRGSLLCRGLQGMMEVSQACRSPGRTLPEVDLSDARKQLVIWEEDPVHVLQLLCITRYRFSLVLRAHHITAASRAAAWALLSHSALSSLENMAGWWRPVQQGKAWSRSWRQILLQQKREGSFEIPAQNQSWKHSVLSAGFGAQCPRLLPESKVSIRRWGRSHCTFLWCSPPPAPLTQPSVGQEAGMGAVPQQHLT